MKKMDKPTSHGSRPGIPVRKPGSPVLTIVAIIFGVVSFLAVAYFIAFPGRGYFHSDCTDTLYWAQASFDSGSLYSRDFTYASMIPFGGSLLMLPWIGLFGVSMTTQIIGMLIFLVLFTASVVFLLRSLGWNTRWAALAAGSMLMLLSLSEKSREIFWGHIIYYSLGLFLFFIGTGLAIRAYQYSGMDGNYDKHRFIKLGSLLFVWILLSSTDGFQIAAIFILPIVLAVLGQWFFRFEHSLADQKNARGNLLVLITAVALVSGLVLGLLLMGGQQAPYENGYSVFDNQDQWFSNLSRLPAQWAALFDVNTHNGDPFISVRGILILVKLAASLVILVVPLVMLLMYRKIKERPVRILVLAHWIMTALFMFGYIFGALSSANWRLTPIVGSSILLTIVFVKWIGGLFRSWRLAPVILAPIILASLVSLAVIARMPPDYGQKEGLNAISSYLASEDLSYGYATFWNANSVTVLSGSQVKVRSISVSGSGIEPYYYQSEHRWFLDQPGQDQYFLLLSKLEYDTLTGASPVWSDQAVKKLEYQDYIILVYDKNAIDIKTE
jgi:hypothetical protein